MNFNLFNLSGYEMPKAYEDKNREWVAYGEDNDYYRFLIDQYLQSPTNNAAIRSISDLIFGRGICIEGLEKDTPEVEELRGMIGHRCLKKIIMERKMLGQAAMQVIYDKAGNQRKVVKVKHFPIHTLRPEKMDDMGVIENYYYHPDWAKYKRSDVLKKIPAFGTSREKIELFVIKPYVSGFSYFSPVDYSGALPYCELENEIADYLLNEAKNSFSGTKVINFNNGIPDAEQREQVSRDVRNKLTGSRGQKVIVAFNESAESQTTVEDISLNDAPSHYEYLANESMHKILVGHRITSPMLLGIKDQGNGLSSNTDEIKVSSQLFNSTVIKIYQDEIVEAIEEILEVNGQAPELYFMTAQPIEFDDQEDEKQTDYQDEKNDATNDEATDDDNADTNLSANFKPEEQLDWLTYLAKKGEQLDDDEWVLVDAQIDDDEHEDENWENIMMDAVKLQMPELSAPGDERAKDSAQDTKWLKVRYAYVQGSRKFGNSQSKSQRKFCVAMENAKRIYRKEDILQMEKDGVNSELGHNQRPYSIWRHKGGVNCHHKWERRVYMKRTKADGTPWGGNAMNGVKAISVGQAKKMGFDPKRNKFKNDKRVAEAQIDRADKGHHPSYRKPTKRKRRR